MPSYKLLLPTDMGGQIVEVNLDAMGYMAHVVVRELAVQLKATGHSVPEEAIVLRVRGQELNLSLQVDAQLAKITGLEAAEARTEPIEVVVSQEIMQELAAKQGQTQALNAAMSVEAAGRRKCIRLSYPVTVRGSQIIALARRTPGASRRGGWFWLQRVYYVGVAKGTAKVTPDWYTAGELKRLYGE